MLEPTTEERQAELRLVQKRMQSIWDRIEYMEWHNVIRGPLFDQAISNLWLKFTALEVEERILIRPGFPWRREP